MNALANSVQWVWAFIVAAQLVLLYLLISRGNFRRLQYFTFFIALNICQAGLLFFLIYTHPATWTRTFRNLAWASQAVILLAQAFATTEVLRLVLGRYQAIWRLAWKLILTTSLLVLIFVIAMNRGDVKWALMKADRGYNFIFATALVACLLMFRYYQISILPIYKTLLAGFCFLSCVEILINTILKSIFYAGFRNYESVWQIVTIGSFAVAQVAWGIVLRKPLPVEDTSITRLPPDVYGRLSPEINLGLRQLDERLGKFWKVEASRH